MEKPATQFIRRRRRMFLPLVAGIVMFIIQLSGQYGAGSGYGLLLVSVVLLIGGVTAASFLIFTQKFSTKALVGSMKWLFWAGAWLYVIAVLDLSGHFIAQGLAGNIELRWMLFGPAAVLTLILFDIGLYRLLYQGNRPSWQRYREVITRENSQPVLARKTFLMDVVLHVNLLSVSGLRWLRHTLIYWGFALMFGLEIITVFIREGIPAFGMTDIWDMPGHPVRLAFDFAFDFFGLMVLIGCVLSFIWRVRAGRSDERKFADTPTVVFLFIVVVSGFVVEGARFASEGMPVGSGYSFVGYALTSLLSGNAGLLAGAYVPAWYFHVFGSLAFIVYVPTFRLIHSCATPIGRIITSQKKMLSIKRMTSIGGLMSRRNQQFGTEYEAD